MPGKRRAPMHRAIIYGGVLGGLTNERINALLHEVGERPLPTSSYEAIRKHYVPYFEKDMCRLGAAIEKPADILGPEGVGRQSPAKQRLRRRPQR